MHRRAGRERHDQSQRPWPEFLGQSLCTLVEDAVAGRHLQAGDVADERVEAWPLLGGKDFGHGLAVGGVGGQAIDGLRRQRHKLSGAQHLRRLRDGSGKIVVVEADAAQRGD